MATKLLNREPAMDNIRQFGVFDDFHSWTDVGAAGTSGESSTHVKWSITKDVSCEAWQVTNALSPVGGQLVLQTDDVDDENIYLHLASEIFKVASDKPLMAIMRGKLEATTNNYVSMIFGVMDGVADNAIVDATGAVAASKHHAVFYKPTDAATLKVSSTATAVASAYNDDTTDISVAETFHTYMILVEPLSSTDKRITFYYDENGGQNWKQCKDSNGNLIKHTWSLADTNANTGELALMAGIKTGSAEANTLTIDYIGAWQLR